MSLNPILRLHSKILTNIRYRTGLISILLSTILHAVKIDNREGELAITILSEDLRYYQVESSIDLISWEDEGMPRFLGNGGVTEARLLHSLFESKPRQFFRIIEANKIEPYDPNDGFPVIIYTIDPIHPREDKAANTEGTVELEYIITDEGNITNLEILSATNERFADSALSSVPQWRFIPARRDGNKISVRVKQTIEFNL